MKVALVQFDSATGDVDKNIERHAFWVKKAIAAGANAVFFPELSLTGYAPELAESLACKLDDPRFDLIQQLSDEGQIIIGAGMPLSYPDGISISMLLFQPKKARTSYDKQCLHEDELPYFVPGPRQQNVLKEALNIGLAICYEISIAEHTKKTIENGAEVFVACVAKTPGGVEKAHSILAQSAKQYRKPALMANCVGICEGQAAGGNSAAWDKAGDLIATASAQQEQLLIVSC